MCVSSFAFSAEVQKNIHYEDLSSTVYVCLEEKFVSHERRYDEDSSPIVEIACNLSVIVGLLSSSSELYVDLMEMYGKCAGNVIGQDEYWAWCCEKVSKQLVCK